VPEADADDAVLLDEDGLVDVPAGVEAGVSSNNARKAEQPRWGALGIGTETHWVMKYDMVGFVLLVWRREESR
jgi:hypothetical protein